MNDRLSRLLPLCALACAASAHACGGRVHIEVEDDGVYALDYGAIVAVAPGLADCASAQLALTQRGAPVPIRVSGGERFGPESRIEWYGQALHGPASWFDPYSTVNVYELSVAPQAARVHAPAPAQATSPAEPRRRVHLEQENLLLRLTAQEMKLGDEPDVWQWAKLTPIDPQPFATTFDAPDANTASPGKVELTVSLRGVSNVPAKDGETKPVDHVLEVLLNGKSLDMIAWDGRDELRKSLALPATALKAKDNRLSLRVPKRAVPGKPDDFIVDVVMFNWVEADFPIRGDLDADAQPFTASGEGPTTLTASAAPELFGSDGSYQQAAAVGAGRFRAQLSQPVAYAVGGAARRMPRLRAVAARDLREETGGYDYVIVAHPSLRDAVAPLAAYHAAHGLRVANLDVDDVYDAFSAGIPHPQAIRDLMLWGRAHWRVAPKYLLLVGDASSAIHHDPRNGQLTGASYSLTAHPPPGQVLSGAGFAEMASYSYPDTDARLATRNLIPTWQYPAYDGQAASDNEFVTLKPGDFHPSLAVGRLPVVRAAEVKAIVDKTLAYFEHPAPGDWRREVTFISTSEMANFKNASDALAADLNRAGYATRSIYSDANGRDPASYQKTRETLRSNLNAGNLIVHFLGHGGSYIWRVGAMGDLFSLEDVSALTNAGRYPMVLAMTCFSAPFDNPSDDSIGERFLREADKGAVAVFAASWKNSPNPEYSRPLIQDLLKPGMRIGDAIVAAKAKIGDPDFVAMYNLLGDPALVLAQPDARIAFQRSDARWDKKLAVRIPGGTFGGEVTVDWLDTHGQVLDSRQYQARDAQFALAPPDGASDVRVYAVDTRNGASAFGAASLLPPPAPVVVQAPPPPKPLGPLPPPHRFDPADDISALHFESTDAPTPGARGDASARR